MEIKIGNKKISDYEYSSIKTTRDTNTTFKEQLNKAITSCNNVQTSIKDKDLNGKDINKSQSEIGQTEKSDKEELTEKHKEIVSKAIEDMEKIFNINMSKNPDEYYKKNKKINITEIIRKYGNNVSSNDLNDLEKTVTSLWKEGMIDDDDYFNAIKWITLKVEQKTVKLKLENEKKHIQDIITDKNKKIDLYKHRINR
ncbi:hypothetical protein [Clostridium uliginosum]|uniref:Uncharacterized protein n=1 Tax=Clostridium uliginosum TaxID=119641 RepID=A0A1I1K434_9CLOT|nr:hypothetical protein [Clostridium uliginosum]SFC55727.1 hypothetical protein SAMN05421842_10563 [Clostridium uliginosum]